MRFIALALLVAGCGHQPSPPPTYTPAERCTLPEIPAEQSLNEKRDLVYYTPDSQPQALDIAWPRTAGPHPLVVLIHGGGWAKLDKKGFRRDMRKLAGLGYAAATINYRLVKDGKNRFPAAVQDVRCALRWLRAHASEYSIDPARVVALGTSAGAHLASMLGAAPEVKGLDHPACPAADQPVNVQGVINFYGPVDLTTYKAYPKHTQKLLDDFLGASPPDASVARLASPITHLDPKDPPMLVVHGERDVIVPVDQSRRFKAALDQHGIKSRYIELSGFGSNHAFRPLGKARKYRRHACSVLAFLERILK